VEKCNEARAWVSQQVEVINSCPKNVTPDVNPEEATKWGIQISELTTSIMSKPKPAPPAPAEEKKDADVPAGTEEPMEGE
jgi:hypothetical protein